MREQETSGSSPPAPGLSSVSTENSASVSQLPASRRAVRYGSSPEQAAM